MASSGSAAISRQNPEVRESPQQRQARVVRARRRCPMTPSAGAARGAPMESGRLKSSGAVLKRKKQPRLQKKAKGTKSKSPFPTPPKKDTSAKSLQLKSLFPSPKKKSKGSPQSAPPPWGALEVPSAPPRQGNIPGEFPLLEGNPLFPRMGIVIPKKASRRRFSPARRGKCGVIFP